MITPISHQKRLQSERKPRQLKSMSTLAPGAERRVSEASQKQ